MKILNALFLEFSKAHRNVIVTTLKITIAVFLIFYLVTHLNPYQIWQDFISANIWGIGIAVLLLIPNLFLQYKKWEIVCKALLKEKSKRNILLSLFYGFSAGLSTPMRLGEYVGRAIPFSNKNIVELTVATFIDKLFPILIVLFLGSVSSIIFIRVFYHVSNFITIGLFLVLFAAFYFIFMIFNDSDFWKNYLFNKMKKIKVLEKYANQFSTVNKLSSVTIGKITTISFVFYFTYILQFAFLLFAFNNSFSILNYIWIGIMVMFAKKFISFLSIGDLGVREATAVYFAGSLGVPEVSAFNASIFIFIINLVIPSLIGLILLLKRN